MALLAFACGGDDGGGDGGGGMGGGGTAGTGGSGGSTGGSGGSTGGSGGATGGTGGGGMSDSYTCLERQMDPANDPNPTGTSMDGADCCSALGTCATESSLSGDPTAGFYGHAGCADGLVCEPKDVAAFLDGGMLPTCTTSYGSTMFEGRCLPKCFTLGDPAASNLTVGDCPADFAGEEVVCAPCFNPIDGTATGACSRDGDMPTTSSPGGFMECGSYMMGPNMGYCVAEALVTASGADPAMVPVDVCGTGELCAPKHRVEDSTACFAACASTLDPNGEGACVPQYIIEVQMAGAVDLIGASPDCAMGESCAPCVNPLTSMPSGACDN